MRVGVVDVGSNTVRLLVADRRGAKLDVVDEDRAYLKLGAEVQSLGWISEPKLAQTVRAVRGFTDRARSLGVDDVAIVVTAPGRQAQNGEEVVAALERATGAHVRVLSAEEEGSLAWAGAVAARHVEGSIAVCDVGGGSSEVVVGTIESGPAWLRSAPVGALRLTDAFLHGDPPTAAEIAAAAAHVDGLLEGFAPPVPMTAYATGGTARALRKVAGTRRLGAAELETAVKKLAKRSSRRIADDFGIGTDRAATLLGGTLVLSAIERRLGVPLEISKSGMREGVALTLLAAAAAA